MARLIEDIRPAGNRSATVLPQKAVQRLRQVHHATNIPKLANQTYQKASSFDLLPVRPPITQRPPSKVSPKPVAKQKSKSIPRKKFWRRAADFMQYPLIAALAIGAAYSPTAGQLMILTFAVICLIFKLQSRVSFGLALVLLVGVPFFQLIHQTGVSQNAAIYAYELLVVGTMLAIVELWRDKRLSTYKR